MTRPVPIRQQLTNSQLEVLVDEQDQGLLDRKWRLHEAGYAVWNDSANGGTPVYLHREILGLTAGDGLQADHINRNRLDNRRDNLRVVTNRDNCQNLPAKSGRYRGVHFSNTKSKWIAKCKLDYRPWYLGSFDTEIDAARAAESFRRTHMAHSVPIPELNPVPPCACMACRKAAA